MIKKYIINRLLKKIKKHKSGCWNWIGSKYPTGYGRFSYKKHKGYAHRMSYIVFKGKIKKNFCVCHACDNKACINPDHLWLGTQKDNIIDCINKGRRAIYKTGENHKNHKLINKQIIEIKYKLKNNMPIYKIAKHYFVHINTIYAIKNNKTWKHI
jgi:hypothetical protein